MSTQAYEQHVDLRSVLKTRGEYATEPDSVAALLSIINQDHWKIHQEIPGWMLHPRIDTDGTSRVRVDVFLEPTDRLIHDGWRWGPVAIECKKSDTNVGPVLSQALDYTRCVWSLENGFNVMAKLVFIWPLDATGGTVGSVMAQNRIGSAFARPYSNNHLVLMFNSQVAYEDYGADAPRVSHDLRGGGKKGSR